MLYEVITQGTNRMCNSFPVIALPVGKIVHWVYTPFIACTMMMRFHDPVNDRIAHVHVRRCHIDFRTQNFFSFIELAGGHPFKQIKVFFHRTITVRTFSARFLRSSFLCTYGFRILIINIGFSFVDQLNRKSMQLWEKIRCIIQAVFPVETQPSYNFV